MQEAAFNKLIADRIPQYQPNQATHERLARVTLVAVVGPSGVGKTTVMELSGIPLVISDVTRKPRPGEINGVDNVFRKDFAQVLKEVDNGDFVQIARGSQGDFKGTKAARYPESGLATMPITAASLPVFYKLGFQAIVPVFIVPPSYAVWLRRLQGRRNQTSSLQFAVRMQEAKESFTAALSSPEFLFIVNDDARQAANDLLAAAEGTYSQAKSQAAQQIAKEIFTKLTT